MTGMPVKYSNPFFDMRLIALVESLPMDLFGSKKFLLRRAMAGRLAPRQETRNKTARDGHPFVLRLKEPRLRAQFEDLICGTDLAGFIEPQAAEVTPCRSGALRTV